MSDFHERLVDAAAQAIHEDWHIPGECRLAGPIKDDIDEARIATIAVLRTLADEAARHGYELDGLKIDGQLDSGDLRELADKIEAGGKR